MHQRTKLLILIGLGLITSALVLFRAGDVYGYFTHHTIVGDGDSLMAGSDVLSVVHGRIGETTGETWRSILVARGGQTVGEIRSAEHIGSPRFKLPRTKQIVWLIGGTNDLASSPGGRDVVGNLLDDVEGYFRNLNNRGYSPDQCFYTDILPRSGTSNPTFELDRGEFNARVAERLRGLANVIPSGSNPQLQDANDQTIYYDGTHLTSLGRDELAKDALKHISLSLSATR